MTNATGLVWLSEDLRLHDNPLIERAANECQELIFCYFVDPSELKRDIYGCQPLGIHRRQFLAESLLIMHDRLKELGQTLNVFLARPIPSIESICSNLPITHVYRSTPVAFNESQSWAQLKSMLPDVNMISVETRCLFSAAEIEFQADSFPATFSKFRRLAERLNVRVPNGEIRSLPPSLSLLAFNFDRLILDPWVLNKQPIARGGEDTALDHLHDYFSSTAANTYKQTRNAFDGWENSSKWSFWLANGSLSVKQAAQALKEFQVVHGENEDNGWLMFELLWREYFQWYARAFNKRMFLVDGLFDQEKRKLRGTFYPQRFKQWCAGNTPYPIVNACMRQLNATGYMSNRGRQIVASALINELGLDWRCGASYFEQQLIDYDPASNWGNWQYIAGVGADPRGGRQFNLKKQTQMYDPNGEFIAKWTDSDENHRLDYTDAADWPIL
ncbi:hypothetical protein A3762_10030 [Oleiphilus sp. HI0125]|uniref:DASH family cryptochrome n=2 Tax=Oleiphilus sp. HI0125 TaxID=1822266 RepID=UPI0007C3E203|nr:DASH family cryptochrome [Oleiphilus sp. HI0125]KZZ57499.1 hypothetical protein A3762_10030 [Oleiphilus sp. HI0125]